jgi:proteic killer suppression protein
MPVFRDRGTEDVFHGRETKGARKICPRDVWPKARRLLEQVDSARTLADLAIPPGNKLEPLRGDRKGQHSVRINDRYRICFRWTEEGPRDIEIVDYH